MTYIDIIFAIPIAWFAFKGFTKGFITELATLAALLLGIYIAINFSNYLPGLLNIKGEYASLISFVICFIAVVLLVYLLGLWLKNVADALSLGFFNHLLGGLLGIVKVAFVLSLCIYFLNKLDSNHFIIKEDTRAKSFLFEPVEKIAPFIFIKLDSEKTKDIIR